MKTLKHFIRVGMARLTALAGFGLLSTVASAETVNAVWNSPTDVPVTASSYTAAGNTVNFTLNFAPATGTGLMVVKNTGLTFIYGTFGNLARGQKVALSYGGITYDFVANYCGGSGNDLVLVWANSRPFAWGANFYGQLGGDTTASGGTVPTAVNMAAGVSALYGKTVVALAAGEMHSLAISADGTLAAWGSNDNGQLGDGTAQNRPVPVAVNTSYGVSALYHKTVVAIAGGSYFSLALCSDGTVTSWGQNLYGFLGDNTTSWRYAPVAVNRDAGVSALYGKTVVAIAAGDSHSLALCSDGTVAAWGGNNSGQLGDGTTANSLVPVAVNRAAGVSALSGKTVVAIAAALTYSLALCSDGTVAAWGNNKWGQLGDNMASGTYSLVPVAVNTAWYSALHGKTVVAIAAAYGHNLALCSDGTVTAWGYNYEGELGNGTVNVFDPNGETVPKLVNRDAGVSALYGKTVVAIAAGQKCSLALCSDGTVAAWGWNRYGELGDNTTTTQLLPVAVNTSSLGVGSCFTRAASGSMAYHTLALVAMPLPPLQLQVQRGAGTLTFQWPTNYSGFIPQANSVLANTTGWADLTGTPVLSGANYSLTVPTTNTGRFFRVR